MIKSLLLDHTDLTNNIATTIKTDYVSGTSLVVFNTSGLAANDYLVLGLPGTDQVEIVQIESVTNITTIVLKATGSFGHASGTTVTQIPYNKFRIYRSVSGVGGTYTLLVEASIQIDQEKNIYRDVTSVSPYSYKYCFYNATTTLESPHSDEIAFGGYPDWSLKALQDGILSDFGDKTERLVSRDDIKRYLNYFYYKVQFLVMGGESPYSINYEDLTSTGVSSYDLTEYNVVGIFMVEISRDGGLNFTEVVTPKDFRFRDQSGDLSQYDYRLAGESLIFTDAVVPAGNIIRVWFTTIPSPLTNPTDTIMNPFIPMLESFHDYGLSKCNVKDRKPELNYALDSAVKAALDPTTGIVYKLRKRIKQGNMPIASTSSDGFGGY